MSWQVLITVTIVLWGTYGVILKGTTGRLHPMVTMFWFVSGYMICAAIYLAATMGKNWQRAFEHGWFWALVAGAIGGLGAITFFRALPLKAGSVILPLSGLWVIVTAVGCLVFLKEPISPRLIAGLVCAGAAVFLLGK